MSVSYALPQFQLLSPSPRSQAVSWWRPILAALRG